MIQRSIVTATLLVASVVALTGCLNPSSAPTPSSTAVFSSEEEAFAAAEETYQAYVAAANAVDLAAPETFEPMFALTTGELSADARKTFSTMHADGWVVEGETKVVLSAPLTISPDRREVLLAVCQDVSEVTVVDSAGTSVVASDRPDIQSLQAALVASSSSPTGYLIRKVDGRTGDPTCAA